MGTRVGVSGGCAGIVGCEGERVGKSALSPLPRAFRGCSWGVLLMDQDLFCELNVTLGTPGSRVIGKDWLTKARGLGKSDASGNDSPENLVTKELLQVRGYLPRQVRPIVKHGQQDAGDFKRVFKGVPNAIDGVHQLRNALQREELALDWDQDLVCGDQGV